MGADCRQETYSGCATALPSQRLVTQGADFAARCVASFKAKRKATFMASKRVLLKAKSMVYGYHGYPKVCLELSCGHYQFEDTYSRESKYTPGKTKMKCWQCSKEAYDKEQCKTP